MTSSIRFARRLFIRAKADKVEQFVSTIEEEIYPGLAKEKGARRIYLLRDPTRRNEFVSLTLWNSRKEADAYEASGHFSKNRDRLKEYLQEEPVKTEFEVEYHMVSPEIPPPSESSGSKGFRGRRNKGTGRSQS